MFIVTKRDFFKILIGAGAAIVLPSIVPTPAKAASVIPVPPPMLPVVEAEDWLSKIIEDRSLKINQEILLEPINDITYAKVRYEFDNLLREFFYNGKIYQYSIVCDRFNNTPQMIDQCILKSQIYVQETRTPSNRLFDIQFGVCNEFE